MTPASSPIDVLSDHEHQATTGAEGTAYCARCEAVADVKELVEAARAFEPFSEVAEMRWMSVEDASIDVRARQVAELCRALARFDRNQQA